MARLQADHHADRIGGVDDGDRERGEAVPMPRQDARRPKNWLISRQTSDLGALSQAVCHAEGRGFESLPPLLEKALQVGGFFFWQSTARPPDHGPDRRWQIVLAAV